MYGATFSIGVELLSINFDMSICGMTILLSRQVDVDPLFFRPLRHIIIKIFIDIIPRAIRDIPKFVRICYITVIISSVHSNVLYVVKLIINILKMVECNLFVFIFDY